MFSSISHGLLNAVTLPRLSPSLELIERRAKRKSTDVPLLFVHGAYAGAWCWDEYFLPYFAERGFDAYALSLRGHGNSEGREWLHTAGISDYVDDLLRTIDRIGRMPVLIGHSMGGMVVQKFMEREKPVAAALLGSVPPTGLALPTLRMMLGDPWLFVQISLAHSTSPSAVDFKTARRALFSDDFPDSEAMRYAHRFQSESHRAIWDMTMADLPRRWLMDLPPMLVIGGGNDTLFPPEMVRRTGTAYGVEAEIFDDVAHAMMLERGWRQVADRIIDWLQSTGV